MKAHSLLELFVVLLRLILSLLPIELLYNLLVLNSTRFLFCLALMIIVVTRVVKGFLPAAPAFRLSCPVHQVPVKHQRDSLFRASGFDRVCACPNVRD